MGFRVTDEEYARWVREGLIPAEPVRRDDPHPVPKPRAKARLLAASFTEPATWVIPVRLDAGDNSRGMGKRIGRAGHERDAVNLIINRYHDVLVPYSEWIQDGKMVRVTLTRIGVGLQDGDGAVAACKYVRDAVAGILAVRDNDPRVRWDYEREKADGYGCRVTLEML